MQTSPSTLARRLSLPLIAAVMLAAPVQAAEDKDKGKDAKGPVLASFAHPDDERVVGPLLAKLAREGREIHLVIATDGAKGVRDYAKIPAGPELIAKRQEEAQCAAKRLGIPNVHMLGMPDGGLGAHLMVLAQLRTKLRQVMDQVKPAIVITFGPEGGTGHPDHRLIGNVTTEVVQGDARHHTTRLFYASLPEERLAVAPKSIPRVSGVAEDLLTVRIPVEPQDITAGQESFQCHWSQYTEAEMKAINANLASVWNGYNYLRPWNGPVPGAEALFRR